MVANATVQADSKNVADVSSDVAAVITGVAVNKDAWRELSAASKRDY